MNDIRKQLGIKRNSSGENDQHVTDRNYEVCKVGTRFLELKCTIVERIKTVCGMFQNEVGSRESIVNIPKVLIETRAELREQIRKMEEEWKELDRLYKTEVRKRKSKFTREELDVQKVLVLRLQEEIETVKQMQRTSFARKSDIDVAVALNRKSLASLDASPFFSLDENDPFTDTSNISMTSKHEDESGINNITSPPALTHNSHTQMHKLEDDGTILDQKLDEISVGIQTLAEIVALQANEVKRQSVTLEDVEQKVVKSNKRIGKINKKVNKFLIKLGKRVE